MDSYLAAIITALTRFFFCLLACVLLLKIGRRSLGIFSAIGTSLASLVLVAYTSIRKEESDMDVSPFSKVSLPEGSLAVSYTAA